MNKSTASALLLTAMLVACQSNPTDPGAADDPIQPEVRMTTEVIEPPPPVGSNAGFKVTTGGVTLTDDLVDASVCDPTTCITSLFERAGFGISEEKLSFVGRGAGGIVATGRFSAKDFFGDTFSGDVVCMTVDDTNRARVGGRVTHSNSLNFGPGTEIVWTVQDNGEGNPKTDGFSGFTLLDAETHCLSGALSALSIVGTGNVQVHRPNV